MPPYISHCRHLHCAFESVGLIASSFPWKRNETKQQQQQQQQNDNYDNKTLMKKNIAFQVHGFCKIISEFSLEYRTTRERVLQQRKKRENMRERSKTRGKLITEVSVTSRVLRDWSVTYNESTIRHKTTQHAYKPLHCNKLVVSLLWCRLRDCSDWHLVLFIWTNSNWSKGVGGGGGRTWGFSVTIGRKNYK